MELPVMSLGPLGNLELNLEEQKDSMKLMKMKEYDLV